MGLSHSLNGHVWTDPLGKIETIIRGEESPGTGSLPFVGIAESLPHGATDLGRFPRSNPDDRVSTGDIRELELIDAGLRLFSPFRGRIIKRGHVPGPADPLELAVIVLDGQLAELFLSLLLGDRVLRNGGIPLSDETRLPENGPDRFPLPIRQTVDLLELLQ